MCICVYDFFLVNIRIAVTRRFVFLQIHVTIIQRFTTFNITSMTSFTTNFTFS